MNRRGFLKIAGLSITSPFLFSAGCSFNKRPSPKKPNIVFILIDDLGYGDVTCYGSQYYETPCIDQLAAEGMRFTDAYAACPLCSPTRASIMTGKYPARVGITNFIPGNPYPYAKLRTPENVKNLPKAEITIAERLESAGYKTACMGKWHLNWGPDGVLPKDQGFQKSTFERYINDYFYPYYRTPPFPTGKEGEYLTDRLTEESLQFIEANKDRPFFLYLSHYAVHVPIQAKEQIIRKYKDKTASYGQDNPTYAAMIESVDKCVGRVEKKLRELNLENNTVIIFMSDNGGLVDVTNNYPLRGGKGMAWEGGIREPMIVKWPGVVEAGSICKQPVTTTDFYPTILEMTNLPLVPHQHCDGISIVPLLNQTGAINRNAIFWHYPHYHPTTRPFSAIRKRDWKLIEFFEDGRLELYNLAEDIGETNNLAGSNSSKAHELYNDLQVWQKAVDAKIPVPNPDYDPQKQWVTGWQTPDPKNLIKFTTPPK